MSASFFPTSDAHSCLAFWVESGSCASAVVAEARVTAGDLSSTCGVFLLLREREAIPLERRLRLLPVFIFEGGRGALMSLLLSYLSLPHLTVVRLRRIHAHSKSYIGPHPSSSSRAANTSFLVSRSALFAQSCRRRAVYPRVLDVTGTSHAVADAFLSGESPAVADVLAAEGALALEVQAW